jgi:hypothetical protein
LPPTPVLHPIQTKISPDFGPKASNGWRCSKGVVEEGSHRNACHGLVDWTARVCLGCQCQ